MIQQQLDQALAEMKRADPERAEDAGSVIDALTAGEGPELIDLACVLRFAWYVLPMKWMGPPGWHAQVLDAAAELFERVGATRYAEVFLSRTTAEIHAAYEESTEAGHAAFSAAYERSGVDPQPLEGYSWSDFMGSEEASALTAVERALERAMDEGRFIPGTRGWKTTARAVTAAALDAEHPHLPGQTWRTAVLTERLYDWLGFIERRNPALHTLRACHVNKLINPIEPPDNLADHLAPVTWFLERIGQGARLTSAGYLPTDMVRHSFTAFGWDEYWIGAPPRSESDLGELFELHDLMRRIGALRKHRDEIRLTKSGRAMISDPEAAWHKIAANLCPYPYSAAVAEVYTYLLLDGESARDLILNTVQAVLDRSGWHRDGEPPGRWDVYGAWAAAARQLRALGGFTGGRLDFSSLTPFGEATLLETIRHTATAPKTSLM